MKPTEKVNLYNSYDENTYPEQDFQVIAHNEPAAIKLLKESGINTEVIILEDVLSYPCIHLNMSFLIPACA